MRQLLLLLFVYCINSANATNYYFSSTSGNDSRSTLQASNPATPWKTLNKLDSNFQRLLPGDSVLLKRGDTFSGNLLINRSGTAKLNIVIGAYGSGAQPVVTGLVTLTWKSLGNNRYESQQLPLSSINLVTRNGIPLAMGRWPNDDQPKSGYNFITSFTWDTSSVSGSISSASISGAPHFGNGAELVMRVKHFIIDRDHVTSYTKSTINFKADYASTKKYPPQVKYGYYLQNDPAFLDKQNEWYYSPTTRKVTIFSGSGAPSGVKATTIAELVTISGVSYVTFDNIDFEGANVTLINIPLNTGHITIQNCVLNYSGANGIMSLTSYTSIKNTTIANCLNNAIDSKGPNAYIGHNKISATATLIGMGTSGDGTYSAVNLRADSSVFEYNKVIRTGYNGLYVSKNCNNSTVQYNRIDSFCLVKNDGAGLYFYGRDTISVGRKIVYNIVSNGGVGTAVDGADKPYTPNNRAEAIYCDQESSGLSIKYNTLFNCYRGLFLNPGCNHIDAEYNTTYNNYLYEFYLNVGANIGIGLDPKMVSNIIKHNTYAAVRRTTVTGYFLSQGWSMTTAGSIDYNYYARPIDDDKTIFNNGPMISLAAWKSLYPAFDIHSNKSPIAISDSSKLILEYNETTSSKTFPLSGTFIDMTGKTYLNNLTLKPFTSMVLIKTSANKAARSVNADSVSYPAATIDSAAIYTLSEKGYDKISSLAVKDHPTQPAASAVSSNTGNKLSENSPLVKSLNFTMAPNPAVKSIAVYLNKSQPQQKAMLKIENITGTLMKQYPISLSGKINVDISLLPAGVYILNLSGADFGISQKFVKGH